MIRRVCIKYLFLLPLIAGCKKFELPPPEGSGTAVFYTKGTLNGEPFNLSADGMNFTATSSWEKDSLSVHSYLGQLAEPSCPDETCGPRFKLRIRGGADMSTGTSPGFYNYRFYKSGGLGYRVYVLPELTGNHLFSDWIFLADTFKNIYNTPDSVVSFEILSGFSNEYPIELRSNFAEGYSSIMNYIYLPPHGCSAEINTSQPEPGHFILEAVAEGQHAYNYHWQFESGASASSREVDYMFPVPPADGVEEVLLTIEGGGCTARKGFNLAVEVSAPSANFDYYVEAIPVPDSLKAGEDLQTIEIIYTDEYGTVYTSHGIKQPDWASFEIISSENYYDPIIAKDKKSRKITALFEVLLYNESDTIEVRNAELALPVGLGL